MFSRYLTVCSSPVGAGDYGNEVDTRAIACAFNKFVLVLDPKTKPPSLNVFPPTLPTGEDTYYSCTRRNSCYTIPSEAFDPKRSILIMHEGEHYYWTKPSQQLLLHPADVVAAAAAVTGKVYRSK